MVIDFQHFPKWPKTSRDIEGLAKSQMYSYTSYWPNLLMVDLIPSSSTPPQFLNLKPYCMEVHRESYFIADISNSELTNPSEKTNRNV